MRPHVIPSARRVRTVVRTTIAVSAEENESMSSASSHRLPVWVGAENGAYVSEPPWEIPAKSVTAPRR